VRAASSQIPRTDAERDRLVQLHIETKPGDTPAGTPYKSWSATSHIAINGYGGERLGMADIEESELLGMVANRRAAVATNTVQVGEQFEGDREVLIHEVPAGSWRVVTGDPGGPLELDDTGGPLRGLYRYQHNGKWYYRVFRALSPRDLPPDILSPR
jgi:hypothetical protein